VFRAARPFSLLRPPFSSIFFLFIPLWLKVRRTSFVETLFLPSPSSFIAGMHQQPKRKRGNGSDTLDFDLMEHLHTSISYCLKTTSPWNNLFGLVFGFETTKKKKKERRGDLVPE
jgi:hypothetical protein